MLIDEVSELCVEIAPNLRQLLIEVVLENLCLFSPILFPLGMLLALVDPGRALTVELAHLGLALRQFCPQTLQLSLQPALVRVQLLDAILLESLLMLPLVKQAFLLVVVVRLNL